MLAVATTGINCVAATELIFLKFRRHSPRKQAQKIVVARRGERGAYSAPKRRISRNSAAVTGMTDRPESRTSCIFFNRGFFLISPSVTGRRNGLIGARSTVLQSPSFAVLSA